MFEAYLTNWSLGETPDSRDHFHEIALLEARIASEYRAGTEPVAPVRDSFLSRLRLAFTGLAATDACNCPA